MLRTIMQQLLSRLWVARRGVMCRTMAYLSACKQHT